MVHFERKPVRPLYCPSCRYILTGLSENRCPECGRRFDAIFLRALRRYPLRPISRVGAFALVAAGPAVIVVADVGAPGAGSLLFFLLLIVGPVVCCYVTRRLAVAEEWRRGRFMARGDRKSYVATTATVLCLLQLLAAGCALVGIQAGVMEFWPSSEMARSYRWLRGR